MAQAVPELAQLPPDGFEDIRKACRPVVLRGLVANWPAVRSALTSPSDFRTYLGRFDAGLSMDAFFGPRQIAGKYFYKDDFKGFNFDKRYMKLAEALDAIVAGLDIPESPSIYAGSVQVDDYLPGFSAENPMPLAPKEAGPRIWIGHASNVSSHFDAMDNIACVVAGRRRFTLFAPEYTARLYIGPLDNTMAGQPVSLAASSPPDDAKYPLFKEIRDKALVAELEPGDALYLPKLWWHQVEGLSPFNTMINYWWDGFKSGPDSPYTAMLLAMITLAERPEPERLAWRAYFDHYVFRTGGHPLQHLPPELHGILGPLKNTYGGIRAYVMRKLREI